jgi:hypothetical protein
VENPIRFSKALIPRQALSLGLAAVMTAGSAGLGLWMKRAPQTMAGHPQMKAVLFASQDLPPIPRERCYTTGLDAAVRVCRFGAEESRVRIVLHGDSHAAQWFAAL